VASRRSSLRCPKYNTQRLLEPTGYVPPVEYEEHYYQSQPTHAMVAGVN
jgi:hypothetical protein